MPKFDLYNGHGDPVAHLRGFCSKMRGAGGKDELLMAYFSQSLSGSALEWYTRQDHGRWYTWDDLAQAFAYHFQYNLEIIPDRLSLTKFEKKHNESFREYGFRWREQAARVDPPMKESEMVDYFLQALEPTYYAHLVSAVGKSFNEVVKMGGMVEEGLKTNKIMSYSAIKATTQAIQGGVGGIGRKKREEAAKLIQEFGRDPEVHRFTIINNDLANQLTTMIHPNTTITLQSLIFPLTMLKHTISHLFTPIGVLLSHQIPTSELIPDQVSGLGQHSGEKGNRKRKLTLHWESLTLVCSTG